ncbi:hypothetical protein C454_00175 [Haloferax gibbonsii ATCC 33959]|uniref:Uncharacterized protein n=1 Tax=Haloferax gibbonsii (strain ATCC 33959 / DSM 4427 / JCM 8863 / NBRC 102184 / NCIMB 2188 / Ma 2.38) TaxID=1227459 RepID=M0HQY2_HALGM|nr:hypothetical protein C454_00175 [Haloferax gibbonsii ATCC 33959]
MSHCTLDSVDNCFIRAHIYHRFERVANLESCVWLSICELDCGVGRIDLFSIVPAKEMTFHRFQMFWLTNLSWTLHSYFLE